MKIHFRFRYKFYFMILLTTFYFYVFLCFAFIILTYVDVKQVPPMEYNNKYWQSLNTTNGTFRLLAAYLDVRRDNKDRPTIRILGMINRFEPTVKTHCYIRFENKPEPEIMPIFEYSYIWTKFNGRPTRQNPFVPYLMSCNVSNSHSSVATSVSVVEKPHDSASNFLKVWYNVPKGPKKDFAVCVKALNFPDNDLTVKLAEWIEVLNLLGADKIFFYELFVHPNVRKLLKYYEKEDKIHVTPLKFARSMPNQFLFKGFFETMDITERRLNELVHYNDCFYKHMYEYKYILLLDIDEVIMPIKTDSWKELMDVVKEKSKEKVRSNYNLQHVYFLDRTTLHKYDWFIDIPRFMHMLQHVHRSKTFTKPALCIKTIVNTEKGFTLFHHSPISCLGECSPYFIEKTDAQLQHYRKDCKSELGKVCDDFRNNTVIDTTIWKFKKPLIDRVSRTLRNINYVKTEVNSTNDLKAVLIS